MWHVHNKKNSIKCRHPIGENGWQWQNMICAKVLNCTQLWEGSLVPTHTHTHTLCVLDHGWWCHLARKEEMMGPEDSFLWWGHKRRCMAFLSLTFSSLFWCDLSLHMYIDAWVISSWSISYIYILYTYILRNCHHVYHITTLIL